MGNLLSTKDPHRDPMYDWNRPYVREFDFKGFHDAAMAALSAEARFNWMKAGRGRLGSLAERKNSGIRHFSEMIVSLFLHLVAQMGQFILIVYFSVSFVQPVQITYSPLHIQNNTYILDQAIQAHNHLMVPPYLQGQCRMNQSFTWLHRVMMFIMVVKLMPEVVNSAWLTYRLWMIPNEGNHDIDPIGEVDEYQVYSWEHREKLAKDIQTHKKKWQKMVQSHYDWRDEDTVKTEWKQQILLLNEVGNRIKVSKASPSCKLTQDEFPVMWVNQEVQEVHNIGRFSAMWKMFATVFITVPSFMMNVYMTAIGSMLIAYNGAPSKLIKLALKIKFLIKIPEVIFEGYASRDLKDYLEGSCFTIIEDIQPTRPDPWGTWLAPLVKVLFAALIGFAIYEWFFADVIAFRFKCDEFFREFEGVIPGYTSLIEWW